MKTLLLTIITSATLFVAHAQSPEAMKKLEAARIALITERLELTPDQAEKFWPIYHEFSKQQREIRDEFRQMRKVHNPSTSSEKENREILDKGLEMKQRQLNLERDFTKNVEGVISTQQIIRLRKAEDDFREMLMKRVRHQQEQRGRNFAPDERDERRRNMEQMRKRRD